MTGLTGGRRFGLKALGTLLAVAGIAAGPPAPAFARGRRTVQCSVRAEGAKSITETTVSSGSGPKRLTLSLTSAVVAGGDATFSMAASLGKRMALQSTVAFSGSAIRLVADLGIGFKGIRHTELTTTDGVRFEGMVDGRPVTLSRSGGTVESLSFTDGARTPRLKVKGAVKRALSKAMKLAEGASCPTSSPSPQAIFDDCDACKLDCNFNPTKAGSLLCVANAFVSAVSCGASAVITPVLCVVSWELNGLSCTTNAKNCEDACRASDACCKVHCPGAVGGCCNGDGETCCGKDGPTGGTCCTSCCSNPPEKAGANCCGRRGGDLNGAELACVDPNIGLCCEPDGTICGHGANGSECCAPGETCCNDSYCAPAGRECCSDPHVGSSVQNFFCGAGQHCVDPAQNLCCAPDAGPECGVTCCASGEVCANTTCCNPNDLCGQTCCPQPGICLNGNECCDALHTCGGHCCAGFQQCCNGSCCAGTCVAGVCCTADRSCGTACCAQGFACTDPAHGTCMACGAGEHGCARVGNNPTCCADGTDCCANGECCAGGTACCATSNGAACVPPDQCIH